MRAYYDVEFFDELRHRNKKGKVRTPIFVSIGIVRDDGAELHLVSADFQFDEEQKKRHWWFYKNVWKQNAGYPRLPDAEIAAQVREFIRPCSLIVTREGGQDRAVLENLIGPLTLPYCDIEIVWKGFGNPTLPFRDKRDHVAIDDARWHQTMFNHVMSPVFARAA